MRIGLTGPVVDSGVGSIGVDGKGVPVGKDVGDGCVASGVCVAGATGDEISGKVAVAIV